jgi:hypothetical protein
MSGLLIDNSKIADRSEIDALLLKLLNTGDIDNLVFDNSILDNEHNNEYIKNIINFKKDKYQKIYLVREENDNNDIENNEDDSDIENNEDDEINNELIEMTERISDFNKFQHEIELSKLSEDKILVIFYDTINTIYLNILRNAGLNYIVVYLGNHGTEDSILYESGNNLYNYIDYYILMDTNMECDPLNKLYDMNKFQKQTFKMFIKCREEDIGYLLRILLKLEKNDGGLIINKIDNMDNLQLNHKKYNPINLYNVNINRKIGRKYVNLERMLHTSLKNIFHFHQNILNIICNEVTLIDTLNDLNDNKHNETSLIYISIDINNNNNPNNFTDYLLFDKVDDHKLLFNYSKKIVGENVNN